MAAMAGRELDADVARYLFGWVFNPTGDYALWQQLDGQWTSEMGIPHYSFDVNLAYSAEEQIALKGLTEEYVDKLKELVKEHANAYEPGGLTWALVHATAEQRCQAAVDVIVEASGVP